MLHAVGDGPAEDRSIRARLAAAASRLRDPATLELETGFLGVSYEFGAGWRVSGYYSNTRAEAGSPALTRRRVATIGISKSITPGFDLITALSRFERERTGLPDDGLTRFVAFGDYKLSKQTVAFVEFDNTSWRGGMEDGDKNHGCGFSLGLSYRF